VILLVKTVINMDVYHVLVIELVLLMENVNVILKVSVDSALDQSIVQIVLLEYHILV